MNDTALFKRGNKVKLLRNMRSVAASAPAGISGIVNRVRINSNPEAFGGATWLYSVNFGSQAPLWWLYPEYLLEAVDDE